jgi:3-phenylpropionate/cinnamic acid dioxygenase small subunit
VDDRVQQLIDESEIRNLLSQIAQLSDEGTLEDYIACFTEDAVWGGSGFPERKGHDEILAGARERRASGISGPGSNTRHLISTSRFEVDGDTARARSVFLFYRDTLGSPVLDVMGVWEDDLRRTQTGWKLARRTIARPE